MSRSIIATAMLSLLVGVCSGVAVAQVIQPREECRLLEQGENVYATVNRGGQGWYVQSTHPLPNGALVQLCRHR